MAALFDEVLFNPELVAGTEGNVAITGGPELANADIFNPATGVHKVNVSRFDAQNIFTIPVILSSETARAYFNRFWRGGYGSAVGFRFRVPFDFTVVDEVFAQGDGTTTQFPLYITYTRPGVTARQDVRRITKPVIDTVARLTNLGGAGGSVRLYEANGATVRVIPSTAAQALGVPGFTIKDNGTPTTGYTINNTTGVITFTSAPPNGHILTWSGEFDTPMAFVGNSFQLEYDVTSKVQGLTLREILPVELGL